jgi:hypothetical protein
VNDTSAQPCWFVLAACQYPPGMLDRSPPMAEHGSEQQPGPADRALAELARVVDGRTGRLLLVAGDQIYRDATAGLFDPTLLDDALRVLYRRRNNNTHWRAAAHGNFSRELLDDHEIGDNWEPSCNAGRQRELRAELDSALEHFRFWSDRDSGQPLWSSERFGGHRFFFGDTRSERDARSPATLQQASIFEPRQLDELQTFLIGTKGQTPPRCNFVATPSMLLPRRLSTRECAAAAIRSDAWDGYPRSLHAVLGCIARHRIDHCVFLSGDEHLGCVATIELRPLGGEAAPLVVHSIHAGALYAPWPFANAHREDFADGDKFCFDHVDGGETTRYECRVDTWFASPVDGFVVIEAVPHASGRPRLAVTFHAAGGHAERWPGST